MKNPRGFMIDVFRLNWDRKSFFSTTELISTLPMEFDPNSTGYMESDSNSIGYMEFVDSGEAK